MNPEALVRLLAAIPRKIITPRLEITLLAPSDFNELSDAITGPSWANMYHWVAWATSREKYSRENYPKSAQVSVDHFPAGRAYFGVARLRDTGAIGPQVTLYNMDLDKRTGDYGYWTPKGVTGRGLTFEGSIAMLKLGFEYYGLKEIFAYHGCGNEASKKILTKLGFEYTHTVADGSQRGSGEKIPALHYRLDDPERIPKLDVTF